MPYKWKDAWVARHPMYVRNVAVRNAAAYKAAACRVAAQRTGSQAEDSVPLLVASTVRTRLRWPAVQKAQQSPVPQKPDTTLEDLHTIREYQAAEEEALSGRMCRDLAEYR